MLRSLSMISWLLVLGCDKAEAPADKAGEESASKDAASPAGGKPAAESSSKPVASDKSVEACSLLTAADIGTAGKIEGESKADANGTKTVGEFESTCAWKVGGEVRVSLTVASDPKGKDFSKLQGMAEAMARAGTPEAELPVRAAKPVSGHDAVVRADGSLVWSANERLFSVNVFAPGAAVGLTDDAPRRGLAEAACGRL